MSFRNTIFVGVAAVAILASPALADAQQRDVPDPEQVAAAELATVAEQNLATDLGESVPTTTEIAGLAATNLRFTAANGDEEVSLTLNLARGAAAPRRSSRRGVDNGYSFWTQNLSLTLSHATGEGSTPLIGRNGFATGTSLTTSFSARRFRVNRADQLLPAMREAQRNCLFTYVNTDGAPVANSASFMAAIEADLSENMGFYELALQGLDETLYGALKSGAESACFDGVTDDASFITEHVSAERSREITEEIFGEYPLIFLGGEGSIEHVSLNYLDQMAFTKVDEQEWSYSASIHAGIQNIEGSMSARAVLSYERGWKEADEVTICRPQAGTPISDCLTGNGTPALRETAWTLAAEGRLAGDAFGLPFGIAPSAQVRLDNGDVKLSLPVYLITDSKGALTAGVRADYETGDDEVGLAIFVSSAFGQLFN